MSMRLSPSHSSACNPREGGDAGDLHGRATHRAQQIHVQHGTALITALIFLLILTILGITAVTTSTLQERMAGNLRDLFMAQEAADSVLRTGEHWVLDYSNRFGMDSGAPPRSCPGSNDPTDPEVWERACIAGGVDAQADSWWVANGVAFGTLPPLVTIDEVAQQPRYIVEFQQEVPEDTSPTSKRVRFYTVTGWSYGATQSARALLQTIVAKRFDK